MRYFSWVAFAAVALLTACSGSLPTAATGGIATPSAVPSGAWSGDLLYVSIGTAVYALSYPSGKVVGRLRFAGGSRSLCADKQGNVFVLKRDGEIDEYSHGGMRVGRIPSNHDFATGCSVDPTTGNLAVPYGSGDNSYVVIYSSALKRLRFFSVPMGFPGFCAYDTHGNLFVDGTLNKPYSMLSELPKGGAAFVNYRLGSRFDQFDSIAWDGTYLALSNPSTHSIFRVQVARPVKIVGVTHVRGWSPQNLYGNGTQTWLHDGTFVGQWHTAGRLAAWSYPTGGSPTRVLPQFESGATSIYGVVLSLAAR